MDQSPVFSRGCQCSRRDEAPVGHPRRPGCLRAAQIHGRTGIRNREIRLGFSAVPLTWIEKRIRRMDAGEHGLESEAAIPSATATSATPCWQWPERSPGWSTSLNECRCECWNLQIRLSSVFFAAYVRNRALFRFHALLDRFKSVRLLERNRV